MDQLGQVAVRLELPVDESLVRLVRLTVSGVASTVDFGWEDVECCRAAADELCSTLVELGEPTGTLTIQISAVDGCVVVSGQVERGVEREVDLARAALAELIVDASVDDYELVTDPPVASFRFERSGPGGSEEHDAHAASAG
jgi:hypothetical protein